MSLDINLGAILVSLLGAVATTVSGLIAFFARKTIKDTEDRLDKIIVKFDAIADKYSDHSVRIAVLEEQVRRLGER